MRISDWSSDVCSSDLAGIDGDQPAIGGTGVDLAIPVSDATHAPVISQAEIRNVGNAGIVIPERLPRYGIGGVNNAEPVYVVENPIDLERYRRRVPWRQINRPCQAHFANIRDVDLCAVDSWLLYLASAIARPVEIGRTPLT